jgi:FkbM family methyltransferase
MAVFANDLIGNSINFFGVYEREEIATLFEYLAPFAAEFADGVSLDIGANIGNHTLYFSRLFRTVHAFEPNPDSFRLLEFNAASRPNVIVHNFGLGDEPGRTHLTETPANVGQSVVDASGEIEIEIQCLDDLQIENVKFIKIDVEGFESKVISGGLKFLKQHQPIIAIEQLAHEFDGDGTPTIRALKNLGYSFCWLQTGANAGRRIFSFIELATGRSHKVLSGDIPARTHSLIIALPAGRDP